MGAAAGHGEQSGAGDVRRPGLSVVLDRPAGAGRVCRVDAPGRLLRIWSMLNQADEELHEVSLPPDAAERLQRQLDAMAADLERSVSPALAGELRQLTGRGAGGPPTPDELRVQYASLLGWTGGLVIGMLSQVEAVGAGLARSGTLVSGQGRAAPVE